MNKIRLDQVKKLFNSNAKFKLPDKIKIKDGYLTSKKEYKALALLTSLKNPKKVFEIGTFEGLSTHIIALNSIIYTLDLPISETKTKYNLGKLNKVYTGYEGELYFKGEKSESRIRCLKGDSAIFDFTKFKNKINFVFVDGAHTYKYTKNDTEKAFFMLKKEGVILWHDYNPSYWPETVRFLDELATKKELYHIEGTYLVFYVNK
mgnify:FL=1